MSYYTNQQRPNAPTSSVSSQYQAIGVLSSYTRNFTICARITDKSDIRSWQNDKGAGKFFTVDLMDSHKTQIRGKFFNAAVDKFFDSLVVNNVYTFSGGRITMANRQYSNIPNEYEISFDDNTIINPVADDPTISKIALANPKTLQQISEDNVDPNNVIDVIAVVTSYKPAVDYTAKSGREMKRREITITDHTLLSIECTLWGDIAVKYADSDYERCPVVILKGFKASEFNGRSLSSSFSSSILFNPDYPEATKLRSWYDTVGQSSTVSALSAGRVAGSGGKSKVQHFTDIDEQSMISQGEMATPQYVTVRGVVGLVRNDRERTPWYEACPADKCNKKVMSTSNGYRCDKCDKEYPNRSLRYLLSVLFYDDTGSRWVSPFNEDAETIMGVSAEELNQVLQADETRANYDEYFKRAAYKPLELRLRAKVEQNASNGNLTVRYQVLECKPVNFSQASATLLDQLEAL